MAERGMVPYHEITQRLCNEGWNILGDYLYGRLANLHIENDAQ